MNTNGHEIEIQMTDIRQIHTNSVFVYSVRVYSRVRTWALRAEHVEERRASDAAANARFFAATQPLVMLSLAMPADIALRFIRKFFSGLALRARASVSPAAQAALAGARKEAQRMNHSFIGTEHLLLAIMHSESTIAVKVLKEMGVSSEVICTEVERYVGHEAPANITDALPYTPRVKKAMAFAGKEAKACQHSWVGTPHMLLGLLQEKDGVAGRVLKSFNLEVAVLRRKVMQITCAASGEEWK